MHETASFEDNGEYLERMEYRTTVHNLDCCKKICEDTCGCNAVDYYKGTFWCNLYKEAGVRPGKRGDVATSAALIRGRL